MARRSPPKLTAAPRRALSPLGLVKAVFTHHVRLRREARGLTFVLEPETPLPAGRRPDAPLHGDQRALAMHAGLRAALDAAPGSRKVLRHLATVEHHL